MQATKGAQAAPAVHTFRLAVCACRGPCARRVAERKQSHNLASSSDRFQTFQCRAFPGLELQLPQVGALDVLTWLLAHPLFTVGAALVAVLVLPRLAKVHFFQVKS